ncbi:hypothetical protein G7054_g12565 [Neopestalotiopsis clavispora]|nr:hypothetical protein G7054_g12565 [Neopestalotiopsis clavispora]
MQQPAAKNDSAVEEDFRSALAILPPVQQWSSATIETLKSSIHSRHADVQWREDSLWTRRLIDAILAPEEGWNWQRLKTCSTAQYFSRPLHTISLLSAAFHSHVLHEAEVRVNAGRYASPLDLFPAPSGNVGYPIFRLDYSSDAEFELYKACFEQFLNERFYVPEAVDPDDITWYWVDDKARLDGKGPHEVRSLLRHLCATGSLPPGTDSLWICLAVDREAIESMLRVYGPPATRISMSFPRNPRRDQVSFLPYLTAVGTHWARDGRQEPQVRDGEYHGHFKCAMEAIFALWQDEQVLTPDKHFLGDGLIWGDDPVAYEAPGSL